MEHKSFAYARVSSRDQNLARQLENLKQYVPDNRDIFVDKQSGKNTDRPGLQLLMHALRSGDTVYLHSLDRLGRNKEDIKDILRELKEKKVIVRILDLPTSMVTTNDEVTGATMEMVNNLLIEVLGYVAEMERRNIRKRQEEGIEIAKEKGVKFMLPVDTKIGKEFKPDTESKTVPWTEIPDGWEGFDIGTKTIEMFSEELKNAKTVVWNGPVGLFEFDQFAIGTSSIAKVLSEIDATTIIGGGDSAAAVKKAGLEDKMTHISTGGGASLEFLEGKKLPGIECLLDK